MQKTRIALLVSMFFFGCSAGAVAKESADSETDIETLDTIIVSDTPFSQQVGTQKITEEQIARRPTTDGNITELLKSNPNVQFSNSADVSNAAGEIAPNEVSINGEKFYNNNYTIDGISNNDNINPAADNSIKGGTDPSGYSPTDLPSGGTQAFWIDSSLLKSVEVFDSNISAKYGRFTGGVINAELKDPDLTKHSGKVFYRITRDDWAQFHVENKETWEKAEKLGNQPQFTKQQYGIVLNQPINDKAGLLFQYNRTESKIPYHHSGLNLWENQRRLNESLMLKGIYLPDNGDLWRATIMYSPHYSRYTKNNIKNGKFTNTGGGIQFNLDWEHDFSWGKMSSAFAYTKTRNKTHHETNIYNYYVFTDSTNWCSAYTSKGKCIVALEGGYGKFETEKETYTFKQDYKINSFDTGSIEHNVIFGWEANLANAEYKRYDDVYNYTYTTWTGNKNVDCSYCIKGDQYAKTYTFFPARRISARDNTYGAYIEDSMKYKRITATLGARVDHSQYLGNTDISPRISVSYDVFGDENTTLFGGSNRYYSNSILAYAMRNGIRYKETYKRNSPTGAWSGSVDRVYNYDVANLKTPYSDEYVLGLNQKLWNTLFTFKWVNRHGHDQFTKMSDSSKKIYQMTNKGRSKTNVYTLTVKPLKAYDFHYAIIDWSFGGQISKTTTNYTSYDADAADEGFDKMIRNGSLMDITDGLPATDYNSPWSTFIDINTYFPSINLNWNQHISYRSGYRYWDTSSAICPAYGDACAGYNGKVKVYDEASQGSYFMLDWRFTYKQPTYNNQYLEFTVDVNNVLNRRVVTLEKSNANIYKMGRNFWLGVSYNW
ncbi:TonB-dependent receptor [Pasteurellaceae bacterium LIM206]|nr:TonB-dependent receptor [Pasteurellaceae bacterium LIM206]